MLPRLVLPRRLVGGSALPRRICLSVIDRYSNLPERVLLSHILDFPFAVHVGQLLPSGVVELVAVPSRILLHGC